MSCLMEKVLDCYYGCDENKIFFIINIYMLPLTIDELRVLRCIKPGQRPVVVQTWFRMGDNSSILNGNQSF